MSTRDMDDAISSARTQIEYTKSYLSGVREYVDDIAVRWKEKMKEERGEGKKRDPNMLLTEQLNTLLVQSRTAEKTYLNARNTDVAIKSIFNLLILLELRLRNKND